MIWLRRSLTVPLGVILLSLLLLAVLILQTSDTFLNPGFYPEYLRKINIYEFALVDLTTSALDEARELDPKRIADELDENPLVTLNLSTEDIVSSLNRAVPPAWVQAQVEQVFDEAGRYITGERDEFEVRVQAGDQVVAVVAETKALARKADAYNILFEEVVAPAVRDATVEELPLGLEISGDRLVQAVRRVASPEWVQTQVEAGLDQVAPYMVGERDSFEIRVDLADRVEVALDEVKALLRETDAYDLLYDEIIEPAIVANLGAAVDLPLGLTVTNQEVVAALRRVAPPDWVREQAEKVIDEAGPYLTGKEDSLRISISIADNKREARDVILETVRGKLGPVADFLPGEFDIERLVDTQVLAAVPDRIVFTDTQLREALATAGAEENLDLLDDVREVIRDGWTYTEADLREDMADQFGPEVVERLDDARAFLTDGWAYTQVDLREDIVSAGGQQALDNLDRGRSLLGWARTLKYLIYLPVAAVAMGIGFLGGRRWSSRIAWAAGSAAITTAIILATALAVNNMVTEPRLQEIKQEVIGDIEFEEDFQNTQRMVAEKTFETLELLAEDFAWGVATKSIMPLAIATAVLGLALGWTRIRKVMPISPMRRR